MHTLRAMAQMHALQGDAPSALQLLHTHLPVVAAGNAVDATRDFVLTVLAALLAAAVASASGALTRHHCRGLSLGTRLPSS